MQVTVEIIDINDNTPRFREPLIELQIIEAAQVGSVYILPTAADDDGPEFGVQRYELDSPVFGLQTGRKLDDSPEVKLQLRGKLDRETQSEYRLKLIAVDGGKPVARTGTMTIVVAVLDSNDNRPEFTNQQYSVRFEQLILLCANN